MTKGVPAQGNQTSRTGLLRHGAEPNLWLETNLVASWDEHLRQRDRQTAEAQQMEQALRAFLRPGEEPCVTHWFAD